RETSADKRGGAADSVWGEPWDEFWDISGRSGVEQAMRAMVDSGAERETPASFNIHPPASSDRQREGRTLLKRGQGWDGSRAWPGLTGRRRTVAHFSGETMKETKTVSGHPEARAAMHEMMAAFEAFKGANDARLDEIEKKASADALLEEKVARIDQAVAQAQARMDRVLSESRRPGLEAGG